MAKATVKEWRIQPRTNEDLITQLLENRGVIDRDLFLNPRYEDLHDPFEIMNMTVLVERLELAIAKKQPIAIFGDYDHDGTPAAALLSDGISRCGGNIQLVYIPTREEGYSLSREVIDLCSEKGIKLLITVDCGITNKPEIDYAAEKGIDSLVIDHHVVQDDKYPDKAIVVNPKQVGDTYPFKELCGCGLAFKVVQALGQKTGKITPAEAKWFLDLVAISTVCDMVPLTGENRILVHYGLIVLSKTKRLGLRALCEVAAIDLKKLSTYTIGFGIGPRLNAPGRMERASIAYELLVSQDATEAEQLAQRLEQLNKQRQEELDRVIREAEALVEERQLYLKKVILVSGEGWSDGVVGLVAGRLMDKYNRPTIVLSEREDGLAKGSGRSIEGYHLVETLQECEEFLSKFGGHAKAAGLTLTRENIAGLYEKMLAIAESKLTEKDLIPKLSIEATLRTSEINLETAENLQKLEPYGLGNPRPLFLIDRVEVTHSKLLGSAGKHLKLDLILDNGAHFEAVAFGFAARMAECSIATKLQLVGMLDVNEWQGRKSVQWKVSDWRPVEEKDLEVVP